MREAVEVMAIAIAVSDGWRAPFNMHDLQFAVYVRRANAALAALDAAGFVVVPKEPTKGKLISMAIRHNHAFLEPSQTINGMRIGGTPPEYRENVLTSMRQLHEEVVGTGFWSEDRNDGYVESFDRAMLAAAHVEVDGL